MKKYILACIALAVIFGVAVTYQNASLFKIDENDPIPTQYQSCQADSDCVPEPVCHPMECINKNYANRFSDEPKMCTLSYSFNAAYNPEDCGCIENKCTNLNLNRKE
jgi:hypothetical protein